MRRYLFGNVLWQRGEGDFKRLIFSTIRKTFKEAYIEAKKEYKGIVESQKFINGYWETIKITKI
jgi:hypothetical protein